MDLQSILAQYTGAAAAKPNTADHFDTATGQLPDHVVAQGVADAFRSDQTPPFPQMVGQLFGQSSPQQQAAVVNEILSALGPAATSGAAGGLLSQILGNFAGRTAAPSVTPQQASQLTPQQVNDLAAHAEQKDPSIMDRLGGFYAQHPQLVKTLGSAVLAVALAKMANRTRA